jgi:hypothetical protein
LFKFDQADVRDENRDEWVNSFVSGFLATTPVKSWLQMPIGFSWSNKIDSCLILSTTFSATKNRYNLSQKFVKRQYTKRQYIAKIKFIVSMNGKRNTLFLRLFSLEWPRCVLLYVDPDLTQADS